MENPNSWVRRARRLRGIKQEHLAELLDVSQPTISRIERGLIKLTSLQRATLEQNLTVATTAADRALARLVQTSTLPVHLIEDQTHVLLAASPGRWQQWRLNAAEVVGRSVRNYATAEIEAAEAFLSNLGWFSSPAAEFKFQTGANRHQDIPIPPSTVFWERIVLSSGMVARLVTTLDA